MMYVKMYKIRWTYGTQNFAKVLSIHVLKYKKKWQGQCDVGSFT